MAKRYFLGSVGKAEAFRIGEDGQLKLAFVSNTLTDSGLNIQTTKEDIRAGQGAPIQFSFYHDPSVEITLTDVLWKAEYLTAQLGAEFKDDVQEDYVSKKVTFANGYAALADEVLPLPMACYEGNKYAVWATPAGEEDWTLITYDATKSGQELYKEGATGDYCIRFLGKDSRAKVAEISTQIIPEILLLVITAPIFAGDSCAASKGKAAGHITFEIPKFQLNGAQEFTMNMSSNQTMSLSGIALASESADCDAVGGKLLRIMEVITERDLKKEIKSIMTDEEFDKGGEAPVVYGIKDNGTVVKLTEDLTFSPALVDGVYAAATTYTITYNNGAETEPSTTITTAGE